MLVDSMFFPFQFHSSFLRLIEKLETTKNSCKARRSKNDFSDFPPTQDKNYLRKSFAFKHKFLIVLFH